MLLLSLGDWWGALNGTHQVFWGISIIFSILFVIQFVISLLGLDFDSDTDVDVDIDHEYSLDPDFSVLSVRSIIAFFTFFGWAGVLTLNAGESTTNAIIAACVAGFAAMFLVAYMIFSFAKLSQAGNVEISEALGQIGDVYLSIPKASAGQGKIHVLIQGSLRELDAITKGEKIPTGSKIKVIDILNDNVLLVEEIEHYLPKG